MSRHLRFRWIAWALGFFLAAAGPAGSAQELPGAYRLHVGDVIEITVVGVPSLGYRAAVQIDGTIMVPLIGTLEVGGVPWADVRGRIQSAFASRLLPSYSSDGQETLRVVEREAVAAAIVEYRSVWVSGDVARPGEQEFAPQMTVRQAVASAGGLRSMLTETGTSAYDAIRLGNDYATTWVRAAALAVRLWRLRTELGETAAFDPATMQMSPVGPETLPRLLAIEERIRNARKRDQAEETASLQRAAVLAEQHIAVLTERLEAETQNEQADQAEYARIEELLRKGRVTNNRLVGTRRLALFSATRKLETEVQVTRARRQLEVYHRDLARLARERQLSVLEEINRAEASLAEERVRLQAAERQLDLAGIAVPRADDAGQPPNLTVIRRAADGWDYIAASYEDDLYPGDVVEVRWGSRGLRQPSAVVSPGTGAPLAGGEAGHGAINRLAPLADQQGVRDTGSGARAAWPAATNPSVAQSIRAETDSNAKLKKSIND
jgi:polysaccharide export outer membrane protein